MLEIRNLNVILENINKRIYILRNISLTIDGGEILGLVGESGSGKTVLGKTVLGLTAFPIKKLSGDIIFEKTVIDEDNVHKFRGKKISMIFQNPTSCLNPVFTIKNQIIETIRNSNPDINASQAKRIAIELLKKVEIDHPDQRLDSYPHNLSGGMNQRVMIALALATNPEILIADEPTTALDVTVQSSIIDLLKNLNKNYNLSILFITHDLNLIINIADRVAVIYAGEILEIVSKEDLKIKRFKHPYTELLNRCIPTLEEKKDILTTIPGEITNNTEIYENRCIFYDRCPRKLEICKNKKPVFENNYKCFNPLNL
ncbi:ABC transporter ATP-binding protein [Deferribacterales bacterium Es71-Z0220]|uniref:ABC transporter ATP-binding protein n=1 Tax=Deferrivibrio essentukiensis TaxID=2880922 RepID=UPI001F619C1A|nr:ABC transporter ATP-binding protein [Deferrivibrio essentukiensis]MCB4205154.1 ABC transporter ATP-binding protein [Deferrivibrio essentukiensis]